MTISNLIAENNIQGAISMLEHYGCGESFQLSGRFNRLKKEEMLGMVSRETFNIQRNQIVAAILYCAEKYEKSTPSFVSQVEVKVSVSFEEQRLLEIIQTNKRRRPELAQKAQQILDSYREWSDSRQTTPTFDPTERRLKAIKEAVATLMEQLENERKDSLEKAVERIAKLLESPVPTYTDLKEAYELVAGRGGIDSWIEIQLTNQPDDAEVRIQIAERIETSVSKIRVR